MAWQLPPLSHRHPQNAQEDHDAATDKEAGASVVSGGQERTHQPLLLGNRTLARRSLAQCHEPPVLACTGSACFIARLSSSVENVDRRKRRKAALGQDVLDGGARPRDGVQADVDTLRQVSATTSLNDPTTTRGR